MRPLLAFGLEEASWLSLIGFRGIGIGFLHWHLR